MCLFMGLVLRDTHQSGVHNTRALYQTFFLTFEMLVLGDTGAMGVSVSELGWLLCRGSLVFTQAVGHSSWVSSLGPL